MPAVDQKAQALGRVFLRVSCRESITTVFHVNPKIEQGE
jgi:hypothetical protein